jgi:protein-S-isoprenylcysteine O-methyltransferase Ste14
MEPLNKLLGRLFVQTAIWLAISAALLFGFAGTVMWPEAWVLLALMGGIGLVSGVLIARHDPALLRERLSAPLQETQKGWDKVLLMLFFGLWIAQHAVSALDAVRFETSHVPLTFKVIGALAVALSLFGFHVVMRANTFAAPVVKIDTARGHRVIDTGPYAYVRHPMYSCGLALVLGAPLLLGSWWGVAMGLIAIGLLAWRAVLEEETLKAELDGYAAYMSRVRYRLVPGVW